MTLLRSLKLKQLEKLTLDNSPVILTAIGVAGVVGTAVLAHQAALRVRDMEDELQEVAEGKEHLRRVWKFYIPTVSAGVVTIGAVVMANRIGAKRAAALATAYTVLDRASTEYREKVTEKFGEAKERAVRDEIAQDRVRNNPPNEGNVVLIGSGEVLCCELFTGRYFNSSVEEIKKAMNDTNYQLNTHGYASISDFYDRIGLPHTSMSDELGWRDNLMELEFSTVLSEDGRPCVAINYKVEPVRNFHRFH